MKIKSSTHTVPFELVRVSRSNAECGVCPNTIRSYARQGLALYRKGRATFFSRSELEAFIRNSSQKVAAAA